MAILLVNIEDKASVALNEFYDYNGHCYALSCRRDQTDGPAINFNDFYDCTVATKKKSDVTVVFCEKEGDEVYLLGWYKNAQIISHSRFVTMFLQGNIVASSSEVINLGNRKQVENFRADFLSRNYEVIEMEDSRYDILSKHIYTFDEKYNAFARCPYIHVVTDPRCKRNFDISIKYCESIALAITEDRCRGIADIKALHAYATEAMNADRKRADGYYYLAMACYHLGYTKEGIKTIEKALKIEPEAADINALKANLLVSMEHFDAAAELYKKAAELDDAMADTYLEHEKRVQTIKRQNSFCSGF